MAMAGRSSGLSLEVRKMAVGPSAPPMMPMDPAPWRSNPIAPGQQEGDEDAQLGGRAEEEALGIGDQRSEIRHRADPHEDERRVDAELDAVIQVIQETARLPVLASVHDAAQRYVRQEHAEGDGHEQERLELLDDAQVEKHAGYRDHDQVRPPASTANPVLWRNSRVLSNICVLPYSTGLGQIDQRISRIDGLPCLHADSRQRCRRPRRRSRSPSSWLRGSGAPVPS